MNEKNPNTESQEINPNDRWIIWPFIFVMCFPIMVTTLTAFDFPWIELLLILTFVIIELALIGVLPIFAIKGFKGGFKKKAFSMAILPVVAGLILISAPFCQQLGDILRFYCIRGSLQIQVDHAGGDDSKKLVIFVTGGFLDTVYGYAYDGSDELRFPAGKQSAAWKKRAYQTEFQDLCFEADHITGHYYSWVTTHGC